jgi:FAD:protein FMN transferase
MKARGVSRREALRITAVAGVSVLLGDGLLKLIRSGSLHEVTVSRIRLGTGVRITVFHPEKEVARAMVEGAFHELERLEAIFSRHRPDTPVSRLGRDGIVERAPNELVEVLKRSAEYSERTAGAFDVTVLPLLELYREGPGAGGPPPTPGQVEEARSRVGYRGLHLSGTTAWLERPGMAITLDGIAKGYIVDRAVQRLEADGAQEVTVEAGGDLATGGAATPRPRPHEVAIVDPEGKGRILGSFRTRGKGVATSGDYVHAFAPDRRFHHIVDPRTGVSPIELHAVTVTASSAMDADALSTAAFVLGPEDGIELLEATPGAEGLLVLRDGGTVRTSGFPDYST